MDTYLFEYNKQKLKKILWDPPVSVNVFTSILDIYNPYSSNPLQKFIVRLDNVVIRSTSASTITVALPKSENKLGVVPFIYELDKMSRDVVNSYSQHHRVYHSRLEELKHSYPLFTLDISQNSKLFSIRGEQKDFNEIKIKDTVSIFAIYNGVLFSQTSIRPVWEVLQMKFCKELDTSTSLFDELTFSIQKPITHYKQTVPHKATVCSSSNITTLKPQRPSTPSRLFITPDLLSNVKSRLRNKDTVSIKKVDNPTSHVLSIEDNPMSRLKKTITKEPRSMSNILTLEYMNRTMKENRQLLRGINKSLDSFQR